jgi:hypothetical protein
VATALQFADGMTVEYPQATASMRTLTTLYFLTFWAILLTGAVRKWVLPGVSAMYLLQDVPIGIAYFYALWRGLFDRGQLMLMILVMAAVITIQALAQIMFVGHPPLIAFIGLHNYLFYWPIILIFPAILTPEVRQRMVKLTLLLSVPMSLLAIVQNAMPKSAWINKTSEGEAFGVTGADVARVSGTFNFALYYGLWVMVAVSFCIGEWLLPKHRRVFKSTWMLILCTFTSNLCHLIGASRMIIMLAGVATVGGLVAAFLLRSTRAIAAIAGIFILLPVVGGITYIISPDEVNILVERFTSEHNVDEGKNRIALIAVGFATEPDFSFAGAGIGQGVDAAHVGNANAYQFTYTLSEYDTIRTVMELGTPVGLFYIAIRFGFILGMVVLAVRVVREGSSPHVLPLSFCLLADVYLGDLTRSATMTSSQIFMGYAFILGAYYYPDDARILEMTAA